MPILIVLLPLLGSLFSGFGGRYLGPKGSGRLATFCMLLTLCLVFTIFYKVGIQGEIISIVSYSWVNSELFNVSFGFLFDSLTVVMLVVVCSISTLVHLYSMEYMSHDPHLPRFMSYLSLFTFFMLILVTANNLLQMFVGWEGVGLCSYLLINFWFTRIQANKAAIKAMIMNRIGDFALAIAIFLSLYLFNTLDYSTIFNLAPFYTGVGVTLLNFNISCLEFLCFLLFLGAVGKSAQLGLHTWLPDAMEGPTPVSALIHAATMVTAGVFLIARCSPIFEYAPTTLSIVTCIGGITAFFAATTGLLQNDLKKVIAYSTCSQLGYMIFACGVSNYAVAIFHLANHAFFKALLFLGAGSVIHGVADEQDMRKMGGLRRLLPFTYAMMLIGSLALMGFPFLTGFYSKDVILEVAFAKYSSISQFAYWLGTFAAFCTAFYSMRLLYLTFLTNPNGKRVVIENAHESGWKMLLPLAILAIPSIFIGYFTKDLFIGLGTDFWGASLFQNPFTFQLIDAEFLPHIYKLTPLFFSFSGAILAYIFYTFNQDLLYSWKISKKGQLLYSFLNRKWYIDRIYNEFISQKIMKLGFDFTYKAVDRGIIETFGPFGITNNVKDNANKLQNVQSGYLYHYTFLILIGATLFLFSITFLVKISALNFIIFLFVVLFFLIK
jgi:NADH-ubiquinone oxidoreductase chain 5